jgi:hypothetical protein
MVEGRLLVEGGFLAQHMRDLGPVLGLKGVTSQWAKRHLEGRLLDEGGLLAQYMRDLGPVPGLKGVTSQWTKRHLERTGCSCWRDRVRWGGVGVVGALGVGFSDGKSDRDGVGWGGVGVIGALGG